MTKRERREFEAAKLQTLVSAKMLKLKTEIKITPEDEEKRIKAMKDFKDRQKHKTHEETYIEFGPDGKIVNRSNETRR